MPIPLLALAGVQALAGAGQAAFSGTGKAMEEREGMLKNAPQYTGGGSILDYYKQAYQKASVLPTELASYKTQMQKIGESTAQGLGALAGRRSALAGVGGLIRGQQQAQQQAVVAGEAEQARKFGQLGSAAQMKTAEETKRYNLNVLAPYERQLQAATQKLQAAQARKDAGLQNIIGGVNLAAMGSLSGLGGTKTDKTKTTILPEKISSGIKTITNVPLNSNRTVTDKFAGSLQKPITKPTGTGIFNIPGIYPSLWNPTFKI